MSDKPSCDQLIELFPDPFVIIDRNYQIVAANERYTQHYQADADSLVGRNCYEISHGYPSPCSQHGESCPLETVMQTGRPTTVMHIHCTCGEEEHVQLNATPITNDSGEVMFMGETIQPIEQQEALPRMLVGRSNAILRLTSLLHRVANTQSTVLLQGESGTGKECVAHYIHGYSDRSEKPLVIVDCGALGDSLIESELFGYEKGAFTGATQQKIGLIESANGGTLFIDEIGDLPLSLQTKLLRVLETGTIRRIGGNDYRKVDVRIIAATHRNIAEMVKDGEFRQDLYYRLAAFPIELPSLRERKEDIPELVEYFISPMSGGDRHLPLSPEVIEHLLSYDYPGNVRELRNLIERGMIMAGNNVLRPEHLVFDHPEAICQPGARETLHWVTEGDVIHRRNGRLTLEQVHQALVQHQGHRADTARSLGISERTLYRYIKRLDAQQGEAEKRS